MKTLVAAVDAWNDEILKAAGVAAGKLPRLVPSGTQVGVVSRRAAPRCGLAEGTPLTAGGGD